CPMVCVWNGLLRRPFRRGVAVGDRDASGGGGIVPGGVPPGLGMAICRILHWGFCYLVVDARTIQGLGSAAGPAVERFARRPAVSVPDEGVSRCHRYLRTC